MKAEVQDDGGTKRTVVTSITVGALLDRYLVHCEQQDRSPTTLHEYRRMAEKVLKPRFGTMRVGDLDHDHLDALYADLRAKGLRAGSIRHVHSLMSSSLRFGQKKRLVKLNVASLASPPPRPNHEVEAPTVEQVQAVIVQAEGVSLSFGTLVVLAALTGARRGELCALRWSDIDFTTSTLTIRESVYEKVNADGPRLGIKGTKTRQKRRLGLDPVCIAALRRHKAGVDALAHQLELEVPPDAFMFSDSPQGSEPLRPGIVTERYARTAKAVGANTRLHTLRHFHATVAIAAGYDPVTVSKRLGHHDASMTLRTYAHALESRDRELAAAIGRTLETGA
jgi:integrase